MKNLTLKNIADSCGGKLILNNTEDAEKEVSSIIIDSRKCTENCAFVATKGERVDGHSFIKQVFENGALVAICEEVPDDIPSEIEKNYIVVNDSFVALKKIAEFYREQLDVKIVGIVGSVGKTSTKEIVASVLSERFSVQKTAGNFNNEVGVPLTLFSIDESHEVAVVEMGISDFGEMSRLSKMVKPNVVVMTNIGPCHLEQLKDLKGVLKAKSEVFESMNKDGTVILNGDDLNLRTIEEVNGKLPIFFGLEDKNDYYAANINNLGLEGTSCSICDNKEDFTVKISIPGEHMVLNALAATAVGNSFGMDVCEIKAGIEKAKGIAGRSNIIVRDDVIIIDDCYNANPKSMRAAIDLLSSSGKMNIAILGDMFELGDNEAELHAGIGEYLKDKPIDILVCIGNLSKNIYDNANISESKKYWFSDLDKFINEIGGIISLSQRSDKPAILIKASHGMHFEKLLDVI